MILVISNIDTCALLKIALAFAMVGVFVAKTASGVRVAVTGAGTRSPVAISASLTLENGDIFTAIAG